MKWNATYFENGSKWNKSSRLRDPCLIFMKMETTIHQKAEHVYTIFPRFLPDSFKKSRFIRLDRGGCSLVGESVYFYTRKATGLESLTQRHVGWVSVLLVRVLALVYNNKAPSISKSNSIENPRAAILRVVRLPTTVIKQGWFRWYIETQEKLQKLHLLSPP